MADAADGQRPDPDRLLAQLELDSGERPARGRLKIFFGLAAGVGKTYVMLESAHAQREQGADLVVGYFEPHKRPETEALLAGLEAIPPRLMPYRGTQQPELDLDRCLARHPAILLVDELAHSNVPGSRHAKRWQDVQELLDAGIDVWTTLNVQHIESLNDIVSGITGVTVRETVPDAVFDESHEIELVDISPDELLQRFRDGKVYHLPRAQQAMASFFQKANLVALREIALRRAADRVNAQVQTAWRGHGSTRTWATQVRLLVCVGPSPSTQRVVRTARRVAAGLHARWFAVAVTDPTAAAANPEGAARQLQNLRLAENLGAETVTLQGTDVAAEILAYANSRNVTTIMVGRVHAAGRFGPRRHTVVERLLAGSGDIDVLVVSGSEDPAAPASRPRWWRARNPVQRLEPLPLVATIALATLTALGLERLGLAEHSVVLIFLLAVTWLAARHSLFTTVVGSMASVLAFNYFFTEPRLSFRVDEPQYLLTFAAMFVIALVISTLTSRARTQAEASRWGERRAEALFRLSRELVGTAGVHQIATTAEQEIAEFLGDEVLVFLPDKERILAPAGAAHGSFGDDPSERAVAQWTFERGRPAGAGTDTLPDAQALYLPLSNPDGQVGVLAIRPRDDAPQPSPAHHHMLETLASLVALGIERDRLSEHARGSLVQAESERLRSALLSSVSHDLRTPLAVIAGASSGLLEPGSGLDGATRRELLQTIYDEADRLARLVDNLLSMTRIESGGVRIRREWQPVDEILGSAIARLRRATADARVTVRAPADAPLVSVDGLLMEQVLFNLLDNAVHHAGATAPVEVVAGVRDGELSIEVADRGPGVPRGWEERVFEKFVRAGAADSEHRGAGLGLSICRAVVEAHGGRLWYEPRSGGGARFRLTIPQEGAAPEVPDEGEASDGDPPAAGDSAAGPDGGAGPR